MTTFGYMTANHRRRQAIGLRVADEHDSQATFGLFTAGEVLANIHTAKEFGFDLGIQAVEPAPLYRSQLRDPIPLFRMRRAVMACSTVHLSAGVDHLLDMHRDGRLFDVRWLRMELKNDLKYASPELILELLDFSIEILCPDMERVTQLALRIDRYLRSNVPGSEALLLIPVLQELGFDVPGY